MKHLIFIVAYNHEKFIEKVLERLPNKVKNENYQILIVDDASQDKTFQLAQLWKKNNKDLNIKILKNSKNYGYGGNQKIGMQYAIKNNFETLILLHGDGQYAPEIIIDFLNYHLESQAALTLGSRMLIKLNALKGKMPFYKFVGNIILTNIQNFLLNTSLSEFHTGYRIYSIKNLKKVKFNLNSDNFHFDTEIILQFIGQNFKISEYSIPTYYGEEISYVNGINYAYNILKQTLIFSLQKKGIFYDDKYSFIDKKNNYENKINFESTHSNVIKNIKQNSSVIDLGFHDEKYLEELSEIKNCKIKCIDKEIKKCNFQFEILDLNYTLPEDLNSYDYILLLDVIEHLNNPENFIEKFYKVLKPNQTVIVSTGNIAFIVMRIMLFFGYFNYGKKGILDSTHTRLFTFQSFKKLFDAQFEINLIKGIPAPYPLAIGKNFISKLLLKINVSLIYLYKSLFSYQIYMILKPKKTIEYILKDTEKFSKKLKIN